MLFQLNNFYILLLFDHNQAFTLLTCLPVVTFPCCVQNGQFKRAVGVELIHRRVLVNFHYFGPLKQFHPKLTFFFSCLGQMFPVAKISVHH